MKVGDYVRVKVNDYEQCTTIISKIEYFGYNNLISIEDSKLLVDKKDIIKSSPNIIDLIEVGDYVNGCMVINKNDDTIQIIQLIIPFDLKEKDIKSIVTREMFESMEYKVGD